MVQQGHYAKKQILCQNQLIAWSHSSRFTTTRRLLQKYGPSNGKLLDYGCGDGTFLTMVSDLFSEAVGVDISQNQIADCRLRFSELPQISFFLTEDLSLPQQFSSFDMAVCMEVLEHCLPEQVENIIKYLKMLVKPQGIIVISVPIEIGPSLLAKQIIRRVAGWLRQGDYAQSIERHTFTEIVKMVFATQSTAINRPVYGTQSLYHGHKGFNWRSLRHQLENQFDIEQTVFSPVGWLGGFASSQVFLICRNR